MRENRRTIQRVRNRIAPPLPDGPEMLMSASMFFDPMYFVIVGPAMLLSLWASFATKSQFKKWGQVGNRRGMTGADAARAILDSSGLRHVRVEPHEGFLSDHYDPRDKAVRLSPDVYHGRSISALAVAAHETGHAIQDKVDYLPLRMRAFTVPLAGIGSNLGILLIIGGMLLSLTSLAWVGVLLFSATVFFQLVTLPVEFDASNRAKQILFEHGIITGDERVGVAKVLNAAAMTYVAAAVSALLTLFYYLMRTGLLGRNDD